MDANGLNPGQAGYDYSTETDPNQRDATGYAGYQPQTQPTATNPFTSTGTVANPFTPLKPAASQTGITGTPPSSGVGGGTGTDQQLLSYLLSQNLSNPQAAIDQFNQLKPGNNFGLVFDPTRKIIEVNSASGSPGSYLTAPGTTSGQTSWSWGPLNGADNGPGSYGSAQVDPSYLQPFTQKFNYAPFQPLDAQSVQNEPGYQFARDQTLQAFTNGKAAQGLFNSGGTVNDLANLASNFANTYYGDAENRALNAYNTNYGNAWQQYLGDRDTFYANENNPFSKLLQTATLGANTATTAG